MITLVAGWCVGLGWSQSKPPAKHNSTTSQLSEKTYELAKTMEVLGDGKVLDGHGATLKASGSAVGIHIGAYKNVTVKNLKLIGFATGLLAQGSQDLTLINVSVAGSATGVRLDKLKGGLVQGLQSHTCAVGVELVGCTKVILEKSDLSQNVRHGVVVTDTSSSMIRDNRANSVGEGSQGSDDASSILIDGTSQDDQFMRNVTAHCHRRGIWMKSASSELPNTLQGNDSSWVEDGVGIEVDGTAKASLIQNVAGHCQIGIKLDGVSDALLRGNIIVGCLKYGLEDDNGTKDRFEMNAFGQDTGGPIAVYLKGKEGVEANTRLFQNTFLGYRKPIIIENSTPCTLQSNVFPGAASLYVDDLAQVTGPKPLVIGNSSETSSSGPFVASVGQIAVTPTVYDTVGGVSVSAMLKPDLEVVVEGSLSGAFEGEEEVLARYKGDFPVELTFPPRIVGQVRIHGALSGRAAFLSLLGDHSVARHMPAEDSEDTLINPGLAVDGDTMSPKHYWQPNSGAAGTWWGVDTKEQRTFTTFTVLVNPDAPENFWSKFHIAVSATGLFRGEETIVATETNVAQKPGALKVYHITPTAGRYIRIIGDANAPVVQMTQFSAYGAGQ